MTILLNYLKDVISEQLTNRDTLIKVVGNIKDASGRGDIAIYPCGRLSRVIINEVKAVAPEVASRIIGCFDKSDAPIVPKGINAHSIKSLDELKDRISLLVVASNTFYSRELKEIEQLTSYHGPILKTSYFDISIPENMKTAEIIAYIDKVYNLLADQKSKMTYLITWLSRVLNDEDLTCLFESEEEFDFSGESIKYKDYIVEGLDNISKKELHSELYQMKFVFPRKGDVVFDIGAYKGDTAIFFASYLGKEGKVYAFEPVKSNYDSLLKNIKLNKLGDVVIPVNKGCASRSGLSRSISAKAGAPWSFLTDSEEGEEVEVVSLDHFIKTQNIRKLDFIKMDVEGHEYDVLMGARETIKRFAPKVVIPLYHNTSDLFTIPLLVNEIGNYKLYMRCKIEGPFGINLYCVET